jgi:hypothetical protein
VTREAAKMAESLSKVITLLNSTPPTNHTIAMTGCWRIVASPEITT